ncbi:23S rRNA (guanosine(2251)-2'-O)-methyltransferase RlmB [Candidatus Bathyarchaeota archaeon]|nr:23S rRNA (guanosine(2251)-2'-O)-methyltransferase RlmB [Candidatus Bathyarchaeota archaeon]
MIQLEGRNPVQEAIQQGTVTLIRVEKGKERDPKIQSILSAAAKKGVPVEYISKQRLDKMSETGHHQGIIAVVEPNPDWGLEKVLTETGREACILMLDQVQDPHNLGAILRTADAAGVDGVVIPKKGSADVGATAHRVSMGGSLHVPVWKRSLYTAVKTVKDEGLKVVGVDASGSTVYWETDLTGAVAFVIGGEDRGINPTLLEKCDELVRIPMMGKIPSLNVSVATAVILYERIRQQESK